MIDGRRTDNDSGECATHLALMEQSLIALESGGAAMDEQLVNRLLAATRGMLVCASLCRAANVRALAQRTERALAPICNGNALPAPERVTVLLRAIDALRAMLDSPEAGEACDTTEIMRALANPPEKGPVPRHQPRRRLRSLLVEDDFTGRLLLQTFLSRHGDCHIAVNGREGVAAFRAALEGGQGYHLVCMDIMMPEMDGREAVRRLRAIEEEHGIPPNEGAKIIMTTALNDLKQVMQSFHDLCDAYLVKPIDLAQLLGHMKSYGLV